MPNTKIVATLGPASDSPQLLDQLLRAGVSVFRLNMSHGTQDMHAACIRTIREVAGAAHAHVAVLLDLQGPKIRFRKFENGGFLAENGAVFTITTEPILGNSTIASCTYTELARDVKSGDRILVADGSVELRVLDTDGTAARCVVVTGGLISDSKGINLPGVQVSTPSLTRKDIADLRFGIAQGVDMIALSFVRRREDVLRLRLHLEDADATHIPVISKIEKPEAWTNLESILEESDGVMVARGDLGVEIALEKVPPIQKGIIRKAREHGKFVITATQMLESMIDRPYPTRAEVSDIANAIYDGTDAVMLSGETSTGKYPVEAVQMMRRTIVEAETTARIRSVPMHESPTFPEIVADMAHRAAQAAEARAIVVFTATGSTARLISRYRSPVPVYAFSPSDSVARQMSIVYGVQPVLSEETRSTDEMVRLLDHKLQEFGVLHKGDKVILVAGQPVGKAGSTNLLKLHRVGEII
jgi:pyruvate kinase